MLNHFARTPNQSLNQTLPLPVPFNNAKRRPGSAGSLDR